MTNENLTDWKELNH